MKKRSKKVSVSVAYFDVGLVVDGVTWHLHLGSAATGLVGVSDRGEPYDKKHADALARKLRRDPSAMPRVLEDVYARIYGTKLK